MWKIVKTKSVFLLISVLLAVSIFISKNNGWLQTFEWMVFDTFMQVEPKESVDHRIVIVALKETDIKKLKQYPVSDRNLATVLTKIKQQKPRIIGLDIFRDVAVREGQEDLAQVFKSTPNLIGIQKVGLNDPDSSIEPHPVLKELGQVSTVDIQPDGDRKIRRTLLYPMAEGSENIPTLGLAVALRYLDKQGITYGEDSNGFLQIGGTSFPWLGKNDGGYSNMDDGSYQILINYRGAVGSFTTVSFSEVLANEVAPNLMRDRIVLVGASAESSKDLFYTPYSNNFESTPEEMAGVEIHANIASQVISTVLENRPLFKFLPEKVEYLAIICTTIFTLFLLWKSKPNNYKRKSGSFIIMSVVIVGSICSAIIYLGYFAFLKSFWLPVFFPLLCITISSLILVQYIYFDHINETNILLEQKNKQLYAKQSELEVYTFDLEEKTLALYESQSNLILALDAATTAIWDWDLRENEIFILHNCDRLLGWGDDCGRIDFNEFLTKCVCREDRQSLKEKLNRIIDDVQICQFEFRVNGLNGDNRYLEVKGKVQYEHDTGEALRMVGTLSDITLQKTRGRYFAEIESKHIVLMKNSFEVAILLDENLDFRYVSPAIDRILGYNIRDLDWKNIISYVHPEDIASFNETIEKVLEIPAGIIQFKYRHLHKDKSWRVLESVVDNCLHEPSINAFVINSRDITELLVNTD